MDVQIEYTFARIDQDGNELPNYRPDVDLAALIAAVDLTPIFTKYADEYTVCSDATTNPAPGRILRTIIATLSAAFVAAYPTDNARTKFFRNMFRRVLEMQLPYTRIRYEDITYGDPLCP